MSQNLYNKNVFRKALKGDHAIALYPKTANGAQTLAASVAGSDRNVLLVIECTETFADGNGAQPTFEIGQTSSLTKFTGTSLFVGAKLHDKFVISGQLSATKALVITAVAGTGTATGSLKVSAALFPVTM